MLLFFGKIIRCANMIKMTAKPYSSESPVYFLHIPKTAGSTFTNILDQQFPSGQICPAQLWRDLLRIPEAELAAYRCFRGHFYAYLEGYLKQPLRCITFLRDPVERSLSHYAHIYREPGHYFHQRVHEQGDFLTFLRDPVMNPLIINYQTRALAIDLDPLAIAYSLSPGELDSLKLEQILETTFAQEISDDELLKRAKNQVDRCLFVGLMERFDESLSYIASILHWDYVPQNIRLNVSNERPQQVNISPKEKALVLEQTHLDYELYAYARAQSDRYRFSL